MRSFSLSFLATFLMASGAGAHPGHGEPGHGFSLVHYLTEPVHVFSALVLAVLVVVAARVVVRRRKRS
ncbi:hypothetical protein KKG45_06750 [bacterium]|nr:hypothetical protein [bacterium]MBU1072927.1 hypothetical protein [bacterium]MBU1674799.1 hypothetical protein [bacterium]